MTVALLSLQMNDFDAAEAQLKRVLETELQGSGRVRFHLGQVNEERKRYDEAAKWYLAVEGGEQYVLANARYAFMLAKQGKLAEARKHLQELPAENQDQRVQIMQAEAQLLRENKEYQESFDILEQALDAQPDHPDLLYDLALAAEKLDRIDVAESNLRKLIKLKPDHAQAYNALGYTLADRTDRLAEAREYIEKALKLSPDDPFILDSMGWVHYRMGNSQQSLQYLQRAFQQRPDPEIAAHLGEVLWAKGKQIGSARKSGAKRCGTIRRTKSCRRSSRSSALSRAVQRRAPCSALCGFLVALLAACATTRPPARSPRFQCRDRRLSPSTGASRSRCESRGYSAQPALAARGPGATRWPALPRGYRRRAARGGRKRGDADHRRPEGVPRRRCRRR